MTNMTKTKYLQKIIWGLIITLLSHSCCPQVFCKSIPESIDTITEISTLQNQINDAQGAFEDAYFNLAQTGILKDLTDTHLLSDKDIYNDLTQNSVQLLTLMTWLAEQNNPESKFLLKKMNKFLFLELHRYVCKMEVPNETHSTVWTDLHKLYNHHVKIEENEIEPFQMTLSKAILMIFIVKYTFHSYKQKKETLVLYLEKIKQELLTINTALGENKLEMSCIEKFMNNLQTYALHEPLVKPRRLKLILLVSIVSISIIAIVGFVWYKGGLTWLQEKTDRAITRLGRFLGKSIADGLLDPLTPEEAENYRLNRHQPNRAQFLGGRFGDHLALAAARNGNVLARNLAQGFTEGIAQRGPDLVNNLAGQAADAFQERVPGMTGAAADALQARVPGMTGAAADALQARVPGMAGAAADAFQARVPRIGHDLGNGLRAGMAQRGGLLGSLM